MAGSKASRSAFIEEVLRNHFETKVREAINARDAELINAHLDSLIRESIDLDDYQAPIVWEDDEDETRRTVPGVQSGR